MRKNTALFRLSFALAFSFAFGIVLVALSASAGPRGKHRPFWAEPMSHEPDEEVAPSSGAPGAGTPLVIEDSADGGVSDAAPDVVRPGRLPYNGGVIVSQAKVVAVIWGSNVDPNVRQNIGTFYNAMVHGAFMHYLSEFATPTQTIGSYGSFLGTFHIHPAVVSGTITDAEIQTELTNQIAQGLLPSPDANTVYMLHFPPQIAVQGPGSTGLSCVDYCGYHYYGSSLIYAVIPDYNTGGCAPGPVGCNLDASVECCGDRSAFDNLTKTAAHELMESITDPQPLAPAWSAILAGGEAADLCNFSRIGENAYSTVVAQNGQTFQAQRGFSNSAFLAGVGTPRGCVNYSTTLCCETPLPTAPASFPPPAACTWMASGVTSCPTDPGDMTVSVQSFGGFGSGTINLGNTAPYDGVCLPADSSGTPNFCATVKPTGLTTASPNATVTVPTDPTMPLAESCYGPPSRGVCPSIAPSLVNGSCCTLPPTPFVSDGGAMQTVSVPVASVPSSRFSN
jgi:hypothetical protein